MHTPTFKEFLKDASPSQNRGSNLSKEEQRFTLLPVKARKAILAFKEDVCGASKGIDSSEELDWYSLSIGYFMAKGLTVDQAVEAALLTRYTFGYWC